MDLTELKNAFERRLAEAARLEADGDSMQAVAVLQDFLDRHGGEDADGWLHGRVLHFQGDFLKADGDLDGALEKLTQASISPSDHDFYLVHTYSKAAVLGSLKQIHLALNEIERALDLAEAALQPQSAIDPYLPLLRLYTELAAEHGVPLRYRLLVQKLAGHWKVATTSEGLSSPTGLAAIIKETDARVREIGERQRMEYMERKRGGTR